MENKKGAKQYGRAGFARSPFPFRNLPLFPFCRLDLEVFGAIPTLFMILWQKRQPVVKAMNQAPFLWSIESSTFYYDANGNTTGVVILSSHHMESFTRGYKTGEWL